MVLRKFLYIVCSFLGITCISAQDIDSVYSELLSLLDKKAIDWMESIEYTQRQALLLNKLGKKDGVSFSGYIYKGIIDTDEKVERVKSSMVSDSSFVIVWEHNGHFSVATLHEVQKKYPSGNVPFPCVLNMKNELQYIVQKGMVLLELWWRYDYKLYSSLAVVQKDGLTIFDTIGDFMPGMAFSTITSKTGKNEEKSKKITFY